MQITTKLKGWMQVAALVAAASLVAACGGESTPVRAPMLPPPAPPLAAGPEAPGPDEKLVELLNQKEDLEQPQKEEEFSDFRKKLFTEWAF